MRDEFRILLVEDDVEWRRALRAMYEDLLPLHDIRWAFASETDEAVCQLTDADRPFDLLSLDFLLDGSDGRIVLRKARQLEACRSVVVITGFDQMAEFEAVIEDEHERRLARMTMQPFIQQLFPGRHLYLKKDLALSIDENIEIMREVFAGGRLIGLTGPERVFVREGDSWRIVFSGRESRVSHRLGFSYLAFLLSHPRQHFSCWDIEESLRMEEPARMGSATDLAAAIEAGLSIQGRGHAGGSDGSGTSRRRVEAQLADLRRQLDEEGPLSDDRRDALRARKELLEDDLEALRRKTRKAVNDRVSVSLRRAVAHLAEIAELKELSRHLYRHLKIGSSCAYSPADDRRKWITG